MSRCIDLTGNKYGRLTVLHKDNEKNQIAEVIGFVNAIAGISKV